MVKKDEGKIFNKKSSKDKYFILFGHDLGT